MKHTKRIIISTFFLIGLLLTTMSLTKEPQDEYYDINELRKIYGSGDATLWPKPQIDSVVIKDYVEIGSLPKPEFPESNTFNKAKAKLGKMLFFDARLSVSKQIACASCHEPQLGWGDGKRSSHGHNRTLGNRNAQTIINIAYAKSLFWDGRSPSVEAQVLFPLQAPNEMNTHSAIAVQHIKEIKGYYPMFKEAFGNDSITVDRIQKAIATYERTVVSTSSKFDRFISGKNNRYTDQEVLGLHLFRTKAKCVNCHYSPYFSDQKFHNLGLTYYGRKYEDLGLYNVTNKKEDVGKFRTPTLREVANTGPWMHNGLFPSLAGIVNIYNAGMPNEKRKPEMVNDSLFPVKSTLIHKLELNKEEKAALVAFMKTLSTTASRRPITNVKMPM